MNALIMNSLLCMVYANDISSHEKFPDFDVLEHEIQNWERIEQQQ